MLNPRNFLYTILTGGSRLWAAGFAMFLVGFWIWLQSLPGMVLERGLSCGVCLVSCTGSGIVSYLGLFLGFFGNVVESDEIELNVEADSPSLSVSCESPMWFGTSVVASGVVAGGGLEATVWQLGLFEYSENKNRTNIANTQGVNERIPKIRSLSNCMQDCQWLIFFPKNFVFIVKMT